MTLYFFSDPNHLSLTSSRLLRVPPRVGETISSGGHLFVIRRMERTPFSVICWGHILSSLSEATH